MENKSVSDQIIEGLTEVSEGLESGDITRCPNCSHIYDKRDPPRVVTKSISRRLMAQAGFAAGPWQDGEPPKDGEWYLGYWPDSESFGVYAFYWYGESWYDFQGDWTSPPAFYAKINIPSAE